MKLQELPCFQLLKTYTFVECDASDVAISASLNQNGRPVAFLSKMLSGAERNYPAVEKEALSIIEFVRKWSHLLSLQPFILITDQRSVSSFKN